MKQTKAQRPRKVSQTVYELKANLLSKYLTQELKYPSLKLKFIEL
jgi:hypothetical protein